MQGPPRQWYQRRKKAAQSETLSGETSGVWSSDTLLPSTAETSSDSANATDPATVAGYPLQCGTGFGVQAWGSLPLECFESLSYRLQKTQSRQSSCLSLFCRTSQRHVNLHRHVNDTPLRLPNHSLARGNDKYFPVLYRQPHITLNNRGHNNLFKNSKARLLPLTMQCSYDLGPILGSSSSETLRFHGKDNYANLIHDRRMSMLDAAHTSTGSVVTLKHGPCTMDDTLNQREATNMIDSKPESKRLLRYFEPSGSEFLQMTLFRDQHVSVMNGETPQEWQKTLPTAIGSKSTCGPQDLKNFPLDHFMRQIEARYKSLEHQIQMLHQKLVMASPMSPTGLSFGEFTEGLPIHGSNKTRANPATHTNNEEGRDRHVLHNGGALSMDDRVETNGQDYNGQDYNTARDRKLGSHSPEPKNFGMINKDQRRSTRATVPVSPRRHTFTPRRSAPTLIHPNDGKAMISSANIYKSIKVSLFAYPGSCSHRKLRRTGGNVHFPARRRGQRKGRRKPEVWTSTVSGLFLPTFRFP